MAQREIERREASVQEGQMLLIKGDEGYKAGRYREASEAYAGARDAFPNAPATAELRSAATQRYAQASVELGRELSRKGDVAGAKVVVDKVLLDSVAPDDLGAKAFRAELDDPIRTNPVLTKEHAADVDQVRRLQYTAQGAFDLGKFDEANVHYMEILRIDPHNTAARRGLERISAQKTSYFDSAYDEARAEALGQVEAAWELQLNPDLVIPEIADTGGINASPESLIPLSTKVQRIVIPQFRLEQGTLLEAIDLLRLRASENDTFEIDPARKGLNIAINLGDPTISPGKDILAKTFDLNVSNVPLGTLLKYITDITGTTFKVDDFAVTINPAGMYSDELISRTYRVPPDFLSNLTSGSTAEAQPVDIFNTEIGAGGLLAERKGAQQAFAEQGISFPEGASASFNATSNTLRVVNTVANQDIIQQIIDSIAQTEPVSVAVRVTMLKVQQDRLEELGFDWMLNTFTFGGDSWIPGASQLNLSGGTTGNGSPITDIAGIPGALFATSPITAGNRSGDGAFNGDTVDSLIAAGSTGGRQTSNRAPGILGLNGVVGGATVQMLMRGLNQKKGVDLMAQPSVTTRSGQAASIFLVDEFIYPTEYEPPELPTSVGILEDADGNLINGGSGGSFPVTPATPTAFETRDVGITLEVLPVADANRRYVDVTLNPVITDFDGFLNYGSPINSTSTGLLGPVTTVLTQNEILMPVFSVRKVNTNLVVADGATIVIGGLLKEEITNVNDKTPILGDIPVVGRLFQSDAKKHISTAILFLVNVELLDPTGRPYRDR
jgi:general secretion pathway protein D